uniref:Uncharacterized protein n=1 Tax=Oryza meridionalis TaxID=40149 RepID=A0A0E0EKC6_9ORYZ
MAGAARKTWLESDGERRTHLREKGAIPGDDWRGRRGDHGVMRRGGATVRPGEASLASDERLEPWRFGCAEKATLSLDAGRRTPQMEDDADLTGKDRIVDGDGIANTKSQESYEDQFNVSKKPTHISSQAGTCIAPCQTRMNNKEDKSRRNKEDILEMRSEKGHGLPKGRKITKFYRGEGN